MTNDNNQTVPSNPQVTIPAPPTHKRAFNKRVTAYVPPIDTNETVPTPAQRYIPAPPIAPIAPPSALQRARAQTEKPRSNRWLWGILGVGVFSVVMLMLGVGVFFAMIYGQGILPQVRVGQVALGGMNIEQASQALTNEWQTLTLRAGTSTWQVNTADLGVSLDVLQTASRAYAIGRSDGDALSALFNPTEVLPVVSFDIVTAETYFVNNATNFSLMPVNAGVTLVNGDVAPTLAQDGFELDIQSTLAKLAENPALALANGTLEIATITLSPAITDSTPLVENARVLLSSPLSVQVYDPITDDTILWQVEPTTWANWITAVPSAESALGLALSIQDAPLREFLEGQAQVFDSSRYIDIDGAITSIQQALIQGNPTQGYAMVKYNPTTHIVQSGESLTSIAWDYGIPYLYIQELNNGRDSFSVGESIVIPPADTFLLYPVVPNKRIVVSISGQWVKVYENGALIQDWSASTGITDSPTWKGIYQVISNEPNAYAGNWNLNMPFFIGVYQPIPNAPFTNGFHGFPTRGGGQILWENSIGRRVTYGCILLNNTNAQWLYNWAEEGVVVEIQG
jgi:LysM repeat protein